MLTIATMLWEPNARSHGFSRCYTPEWVDKLYRGFARNLSEPFRFVCFVDREYEFTEPVEQQPILTKHPWYGCYIEPFRLDGPMILVGLDTVVTGKCDALARYCHEGDKVAVPLDPYRPSRICNGVALIPPGNRHIYERWEGQNDMEWLRRQDLRVLDELFPGQVQSFKVHVKRQGLEDTRICYFHGREKPHEINHPVTEHWR